MSNAPVGSPAAAPYSYSPPTPPTTPATSPPPPPTPAASPLLSPSSTSSPSPPTTAAPSPTENPKALPSTFISPPSPSPPSSSSNMSTGAIVGIAFGAVLVFMVWSICSIWCWKKWKKNRDRESFSRKQPQEPQLQRSQVDPYGGSPQQWQGLQSPSDHVGSKPLLLAQIPSGLQSPLAPPSLSYASSHVAQPSSLSHASIPSAPLSFVSSSSGGSGSKHSGVELLRSSSRSKSTFTYEELVRATDGFSDANLLGQGGFGFVHKGILPNDKEVAVKQLKAGSGQGEREFQAEVEIISRVHHKHLVSLVGYCSTGFQRLLAYEFVPNNTLEFHLHEKALPILDWSARQLIALGSAKGLAYLHEDCHPKIIHRDIKAANILLDFKFEAKVADFGLAKIASDLNTHVSTRVMGTFGYLAPEYAASGKLTDKSDVFSYGVVLLELLTGRRPIDKDHTYMNGSLVEWARPLLIRAIKEDNVDSLIDLRLENEFDPNQIHMTFKQKKIQMTRMVACAAACTRHSAMHRPKMSQVVRILEGDVSVADLNAGVIPGHSSVYNTQQHEEDMIQLRKTAFRTQEHAGSSDYGSCSDYGSFRENIKGNGNENSQRFSGSS